jgi:hypothetical protein
LLKRQERKREGESWEAGERKVRARAAAAGGERERESSEQGRRRGR